MNASDLDELAPVIGYRATRIVAAWFAGRDLHTPRDFSFDHPLCRLLGESAFRALVKEYPSERFRIPSNEDDDRCRRDRRIAESFVAGRTGGEIAVDLGLTVRRVEQIRVELVENGIIEYSQGFDSAMQASRGRGSREIEPPTLPADRFLGTGGVSGDSPLPPETDLTRAVAMGILSTP